VHVAYVDADKVKIHFILGSALNTMPDNLHLQFALLDHPSPDVAMPKLRKRQQPAAFRNIIFF
jgi:hypothetical protein